MCKKDLEILVNYQLTPIVTEQLKRPMWSLAAFIEESVINESSLKRSKGTILFSAG